MKTVIAIVFVVLLVGTFIRFSPPVNAQGGMSKATAKLLVTDLIEAGFTPTIHAEGGVYLITVQSEPASAGTAAQVNTFATNRGVTARVLAVRFE